MNQLEQSTRKDRLGFTMFLSISLHAIILTSLGLELPPQEIDESITISLTRKNLNQQFSFLDAVQGPTVENFKVRVETLLPTENKKPILELMIEDLQIKIEARRKTNELRPQRRAVSTVSAQKEQAMYLETWRKRIEEVGNQYYPEQARKNGVFGNLRILVAVRADGQVEDIRILESSGSKMLDDAAERIVLLAAPFDPLPEEISVETDILEIIRTLRFHEGTSREIL